MKLHDTRGASCTALSVRRGEWKGCRGIDIFAEFLRSSVSDLEDPSQLSFVSSSSIKKKLKKIMCRYLFVFFLLGCLRMATRAEVAQGSCSCAVFDAAGTEPLIEHALPFNVSCDEEGADKCMQLCTALARSGKKNGPTLICERLNRHIENLKVAIHTKSCDDGWKFTGLQLPQAICCHEGEETACNPATVPTI